MSKIKKVIVFGGSGFLGKYIVKELLAQKYYVIIFDKKKAEFKNRKLKFIQGNINNFNQVKNAIKQCDYVFNLAGISDIGESLKKPIDTVKINILGTVNILESCRILKIKKHIFASSIYVLSNQGGFYRTSKNACELYIQEYKKRFNLNYTILRYGSIYGEGANKNNGITKVIFNALKTGQLKYSGTNKAVRRFIHAQDASTLSVKALSKRYSNMSVMITGNKTNKVSDVMQYLKKELGIKKKILYSNKTELGHYNKNPFSYKKIKSAVMEFKQKRKFKYSLANLIDYLKNE